MGPSRQRSYRQEQEKNQKKESEHSLPGKFVQMNVKSLISTHGVRSASILRTSAVGGTQAQVTCTAF